MRGSPGAVEEVLVAYFAYDEVDACFLELCRVRSAVDVREQAFSDEGAVGAGPEFVCGDLCCCGDEGSARGVNAVWLVFRGRRG